MGSSIAFAAASAALLIQSATPAAPTPLKPSSPWNVDYADSMCILQRSFGGGGEQLTLGFKPAVFGENVRVMLVKRSKYSDTTRGVARLTFDGGQAAEGPYFDGYVEERGVRVVEIDLKEPQLRPLAGATHVRIEAGKFGVTLAPNTVAAAMAAVRTCELDLLTRWGMEREVLDSIAAFPRANIVRLFSTDDYPRTALDRHEQGISGVRFWVETDGRISDCKVVERSGSIALDNKTCSIITQRAKFDPARTKSGQPVRSVAFQRIRWELP